MTVWFAADLMQDVQTSAFCSSSFLTLFREPSCFTGGGATGNRGKVSRTFDIHLIFDATTKGPSTNYIPQCGSVEMFTQNKWKHILSYLVWMLYVFWDYKFRVSFHISGIKTFWFIAALRLSYKGFLMFLLSFFMISTVVCLLKALLIPQLL